jgi:hypothetical protein
MNVTTEKVHRYTYVFVDGRAVAIMERSEFTGDFCYGLRTAYLGKFGEPTFRPPFSSTYRRTAKAAAKVVVAALEMRG